MIPHDQLTKEHPLEKKFVLMALLCNDSVTIDKKEIGDPTEIALVNLGEEYHLDELTVREQLSENRGNPVRFGSKVDEYS